MNFKKSIILIFFAIFLGAQVFVVFCPYSIMWGKNWKRGDIPLWPFKRYPMYSAGRHPGQKLSLIELRIRPSGSDKLINVDNDKLHIMPERFHTLVNRVRLVFDSTYIPKERVLPDLNYLNYLIKQYIPDANRAEIWLKSYDLTKSGIKSFNVNWKLAGSWKVSDDTTYNELLKKGIKNAVVN